nr:Ger(x)C family spore germination protein [uncultured Caproiciproducens sp.]
MKAVKRFCVLLLALAMLVLCGCWNYREIESLSMVSGIAVDKGREGHKYHLTFEFLDVSGETSKAKLLETEGDTIFDGVREATSKSEKKLFFSECKVLIVSKEIAADGMAPLFDFATRDAEPRLTLNPMVSQAKTAGEILQQESVAGQLIGIGVWKMLIQNSTYLSEAPNVKLFQANNLLTGEGASLILPTIKLSTSTDKVTPELSGTAVFKRDKLIGFLDKDQSKSLLLIKNQVNGGLLLTEPDPGKGKVVLEIQANRTKITPVITNNVLKVEININMTAALAEDETAKDYTTSDGLKKIEECAKKTLEKNVSELIKTVQTQYDSDIFGFGAIAYQNKPEWWKQAKPKWDQTFRTLDSSVTANVTIDNTAVEKSKVKVGD